MLESDEIQRQLESLKKAYAATLVERVEEIISALKELHEQDDPHECLQEIFRQIHSLSGSAGTFGFNSLGEQARQLELSLNEYLQQEKLPDSKAIAYFNSGLQKLLNLVTQGPDNDELDEPRPKQLTDKETGRLFYIYEDDEEHGRNLCLHLSHYGFEARTFHTTEAIRSAIKQQRPDALILDIMTPEGPLAGTELAASVRQDDDTPIPVIFTSGINTWESRLAAVRAGGTAYIIKPVDIALLVESLDRITLRIKAEPYRVLIVDDATELAQHYSLVLRQRGMHTEILTEPTEILTRMEDVKPELILLDFYLPGITGLEIARVIRQHHNYFSTPIVFLSTETNLNIQLNALQQGDEFLEKPISDAQLISAVESRIERARALNQLMYHDSLTGLLNQLTLKRRLETELARCQRQNSPLSYLMLDIDLFKQVNDQYGHVVGDQVLKSLARLLKERLRRTDHIGRYGGEEFGIIMPDTEPQIALDIIEHIRKHFAELSFQKKGQSFNCSFSAGIACSREFKQEKSIIEAADSALYESKDKGRNQTTLHQKCLP